MRHINKFISISVIVFAFALSFFALAPNASADTRTVSLTAIPAVLDTAGQAGGEARVSFQVKNNSKAVLPIHLSTRDSRSRDGQPEDLMRSLSAKNWVEFAEPNFILQPDETKVVEATLNIPKETAGGGHYADIVVQPLSLERNDGIIAAQPELAVQMLVSVAGHIKENLTITLDGPSTVVLSPSQSKKILFEVKNTGNIHSLIAPQLHLKGRGDTNTVIETQPQIILPGEVKKLEFEIPKSVTTGIYISQVKFPYGIPAKEAKSQEMRIIILPFSPKLLLLVPLIALAAYAYHIRIRLISAVRIITKGERANKGRR